MSFFLWGTRCCSSFIPFRAAFMPDAMALTTTAPPWLAAVLSALVARPTSCGGPAAMILLPRAPVSDGREVLGQRIRSDRETRIPLDRCAAGKASRGCAVDRSIDPTPAGARASSVGYGETEPPTAARYASSAHRKENRVPGKAFGAIASMNWTAATSIQALAARFYPISPSISPDRWPAAASRRQPARRSTRRLRWGERRAGSSITAGCGHPTPFDGNAGCLLCANQELKPFCHSFRASTGRLSRGRRSCSGCRSRRSATRAPTSCWGRMQVRTQY